MTFLNATLVLGLTAAAIPLVLHLIARREPTTVPFPAVRFLTQRYQSNRSRLQVRRWWLLLLRILAIAALAITLARPVIGRQLSTTWLTIAIIGGFAVALLVLASIAYAKQRPKQLSGGLLASAIALLILALSWGGITVARGPEIRTEALAPAAAAIVIDNSISSNWQSNATSHLDRHRQLATEILSQLPPASRVAILDRSVQPASFAMDTSSAITKVQSLESLEVAASLESRLDAAIRLLRTSELENRHLFVISNLGTAEWAEPPESIRQTLALSDQPIVVTVLHSHEFRGINRRLGTVRLSDATPPRETPTPLSVDVELQRLGDEPSDGPDELATTVELVLYENEPGLPLIRDGQLVLPKSRTVDRTSVKLSPSEATELVLTLPPLDEGIHHGLVRLMGSDPFQPDDIRYFSAQVLPPGALLIVGSNLEESRLIAQAVVAPFGLDDALAEFKVDVISHDDWLATTLRDYQGIVMLDPPAESLTDDRLDEYVQRGGGVWCCLGANLANALPTGNAWESAVTGKLLRTWRVPASGTFLQVDTVQHPAMAPFSEIRGGVPWNQFPVFQYWQAEPSDNAWTLMTYASTNHAALLERRSTNVDEVDPRSGRTLVMTTPLPALEGDSRGWNQLFGQDSWPAFLLVRQAVDYVTRRDTASANTLVGQPYVLDMRGDESRRSEQPSEPDAVGDEPLPNNPRMQLFAPGRSSALPLNVDEASQQIVVRDVSRAGTYWIRGARVVRGFSSNVPASDAALDPQTVSVTEGWFGLDQVDVLSDTESLDWSGGGPTPTIHLQAPAMLLALAFFLLEQVLSNRFYQSRAGTASPSAVGTRQTRPAA